MEIVDRECYVIAPFEGHYESIIDCGSEVKKGDLIGLVHDFDRIDLEPWPARAGVDGIVVAQAWAATVSRGQLLCRSRKSLPHLVMVQCVAENVANSVENVGTDQHTLNTVDRDPDVAASGDRCALFVRQSY